MATCTAAAYGKISLAVLEKEAPVEVPERSRTRVSRHTDHSSPGIHGRRNIAGQPGARSRSSPRRARSSTVSRAICARSTRELEELSPSASSIGCSRDACGALEELARPAARALLGRPTRQRARSTSPRARPRRGLPEAGGEIEERRAGALEEIKAAGGPDRPARGRPLRGAGRGGARASRMDHRARDRRASGARARDAVDAPRRGRPALPQVAAASLLICLLLAIVFPLIDLRCPSRASRRACRSASCA